MALLPSSRNDQYKLLVAIAFLALAGLYYQFMWSPTQLTLATIHEHVDSLTAMNQRASVEVEKGSVNKLQLQADEYGSEVEIMRQLVPKGNEVPALIEAVSSAARRAGLELGDISPAGVVEGDQFDTYKYKLAVTGPFHKITDFLTNIGQLRRIVAPINITLKVSGAQDKNKDKTIRFLDAKLDIQTYVEHQAPAASAAKEKK